MIQDRTILFTMLVRKTASFFLSNNIRTKNGLRHLIQIAGRPNFPGAKGKGFPQFLKDAAEDAPHRISAKDHNISQDSPPEQCAQAIGDFYKDLIYKHGAILLQGFPLGDVTKFSNFISHLKGVVKMGYEKGTGSRHAITDEVYAASDYSNEITIEPHNEMSSNLNYPDIVAFACEQAGIGGESVLIDSIAWHQQLDSNVVDAFEKKGGVRYHLYLREVPEAITGKMLGADISWKYVFGTGDKDEVGKELKKENMDYIWHGDALQFWYNKSTTAIHPKTGEISWFNQAHAHHASYYINMYPDTWGKSGIPHDRFPFHTYYADGSEIPLEALQHIRDVAWGVAVNLQLQKNEVIMIDNVKFAHARLSYTGNRKLFAAFLTDTTLTS